MKIYVQRKEIHKGVFRAYLFFKKDYMMASSVVSNEDAVSKLKELIQEGEPKDIFKDVLEVYKEKE